MENMYIPGFAGSKQLHSCDNIGCEPEWRTGIYSCALKSVCVEVRSSSVDIVIFLIFCAYMKTYSCMPIMWKANNTTPSRILCSVGKVVGR